MFVERQRNRLEEAEIAYNNLVSTSYEGKI